MIRERGRLPVKAELKMRRREDVTFPSHNTFSRFSSRSALADAVTAWCEKREGYADVVGICAVHRRQGVEDTAPALSLPDGVDFGTVYLLRAGRYYKIDRSNAVGRRERELRSNFQKRPPLSTASRPMTHPGSSRTGIAGSTTDARMANGLNWRLRMWLRSRAGASCNDA
jgi:hypothetical protein